MLRLFQANIMKSSIIWKPYYRIFYIVKFLTRKKNFQTICLPHKIFAMDWDLLLGLSCYEIEIKFAANICYNVQYFYFQGKIIRLSNKKLVSAKYNVTIGHLLLNCDYRNTMQHGYSSAKLKQICNISLNLFTIHLNFFDVSFMSA